MRYKGDLLEATALQTASKSWPNTLMAMVSFFETCGGVPTSESLAADRIALRHADAMAMQMQSKGRDRKPALPLLVSMVAALEMLLADNSKPHGHCALAFMRLVKTWTACKG